jgi:tetratricopeptide (TPR) repeat protein
MYYEWDYAAAQRGFEKALDLNPNFTMAHLWFEFYWTYIRHNYAEAIAACERALRLDPLQLDIVDRLATVKLLFGHFDEAIAQFHKLLDLEPGYAVAYLGLSDTYQRIGKKDAALSAAEKAVELGGRAVAFLGLLGIACGALGKETRARKILAELRARSLEGYVSSFWLAVVHAALGEIDVAFDALEHARAERDANLLYVTLVPRVLGLHEHARYNALVKSIGLEHLLPVKDIR